MASITLITLSISSLPKPTSKLTLFGSKFISTAQSTRLSVMAAAAPNATTTPTAATVVPTVIVGGGRVGRALQEMGSGQDFCW
uniref:Uncharacterized protein MANES_11G069800 n=1 Tax=Rhizophora mucronata TaxID=61149 RepID=A0A2P2MTZ4_RHIMU